jgi:hypothetical protein
MQNRRKTQHPTRAFSGTSNYQQKKMKTSGRKSQLCVTVQLSVLCTAESDGTATVYRFGVGKINAALRAFDHGFSYVVRT